MVIRRIGWLIVVGLIVGVGLGCGGTKDNTSPKAPPGVELKSLPPPGAPGGGGAGPAPAKGAGGGANVQ
jgi:hypothetical protein